MKKHDIITVDIVENASPIKSIAYHEGKKIMIEGGWAGEKANVFITKNRGERAEAVIREVLVKAPFETEGPCPHFGRCGGCATGGITYSKQLEVKRDYVLGLFKKANIPYKGFEGIIPSPVTEGYRNKMEFSFGNEFKDGPLTLGMHERGLHHNIVTVKDCMISPKDYRVILAAAEKFFTDSGTLFYNKVTRSGYLRHLVIRCSVRRSELMINLVTTTDGTMDEKAFTEMLLSLPLEYSIAGIIHTFTDSFADAVKAQKTEILYGNDYITEEICGLSFKITPFSFFQTNTLAAEKLYEKVREYVGDRSDKTIFDLYCGTGTIAQIVSNDSEKVYGIEIVEEAVIAANENAINNGINNCEFIAGDVFEKVSRLPHADVIILDPPRAGVGTKAIEKIIAFNPETFVYVSCKPQSLINDLKSFLNAGYEIDKMCLVDMFPNTEHIETVVLLSKGNISSQNIRVEFSLEDMDMSRFQQGATYEQIQDWVQEKYGFHVSHLNIAQVKRKHGIIERENYNKAKCPDSRQPGCPEEKVKAIEAALRFFQMI